MKSVLVVEDYADLRSAIGDVLVRGDVQCDCVSTPEEAILKLRDRHYTAILLSPQFPVTDDRVITFLRENQPEEVRKVILMTDPDVTAPAYRLLIKPFSRDQLLRQIART